MSLTSTLLRLTSSHNVLLLHTGGFSKCGLKSAAQFQQLSLFVLVVVNCLFGLLPQKNRLRNLLLVKLYNNILTSHIVY